MSNRSLHRVYVLAQRRWLWVTIAMCVLMPGLVEAQANGPFNVRLAPYGATGSCNVPVDTSAFLSAIAAVPASGGEIYVPAGTYCLDQTLLITNKSIAFRGEGIRNSIIRWHGGTHGLVFTTSTSNLTLTVTKLSLLSNKAPNGAGIVGAWPAGTPQSATITDVEVGETTTPFGWNQGIHLTNATMARVTRVNVHGPTRTPASRVSSSTARASCLQ